jgi:hypothetical protein
MTLGLTSTGAIKIKKDGALGLRAVECACCPSGPCTCVFSDGDIVTISALGKSSTVTIGQTSHGPIPCYGDISEQREDQVFIRFKTRYTVSDGSTGSECVPDSIISDYEDWFYRYTWRYSIQGCICRIDFEENTNISDVFINMNMDLCDSSGQFPPGCCVCGTDTYMSGVPSNYETATITKRGSVSFPITGYGTYNVTMPFTELHFPFCNPYTVESSPTITVVLS